MKNIITSFLLLVLTGLSLMSTSASARSHSASVPAPTSVTKAKPLVCREYACGRFNDVNFTLSYTTIKIFEGHKQRVVVRATQKYLDNLKLRISNGILYIQSDKPYSRSLGQAEIYIFKEGHGNYSTNGTGCSLSANSSIADLASLPPLKPSETYPVESIGSLDIDGEDSDVITTVTSITNGEKPITIIQRPRSSSKWSGTMSTDTNIDELYGNKRSGLSSVTRTLSLGSFSGIKCGGSAIVHFTQGKECSVQVRGTESELASEEVTVENGVLVIRNKQTVLSGSEYFEVNVTAPTLTSLNVTGACTFISSTLTTPHLAIDITGAGSLSLGRVQCDDTRFNASGASSVSAEISGEKLDVKSKGTNSMKLSFKGTEVKVDNSGVGSVMLHTDCDSLTAHNSGTAYIKLSGTADHTEIHASGVSQIDTSELNNY